MDEPRVAVDRKHFRQPTVFFAAGLFCLAAALILPETILLFGASYPRYLLRWLALGGISDPGALSSWVTLYRIGDILELLFPAGLAAGLILALRGQGGKGMLFLSGMYQKAAKALSWVIWGLAALFAVKFLLAVISAARQQDWVFRIGSMVLFEGPLGALAWFTLRKTQSFLERLSDCAAGMAYTLSAGLLDGCPVPHGLIVGFRILGTVCVPAALGRLFTVTIASDGYKAFYRVLTASQTWQILGGASLLTLSAGCFFLAAYLKRIKSLCENALYEGKRSLF